MLVSITISSDRNNPVNSENLGGNRRGFSHEQMRRFKGKWPVGGLWLGYVCGDF